MSLCFCHFSVQLVVSGLLPRVQNRFSGEQRTAAYLRGYNQRAVEVNLWLQDHLLAHPRASYLPHPDWSTTREDLFGRDGLHFSFLGAETLAAEITSTVDVVMEVIQS